MTEKIDKLIPKGLWGGMATIVWCLSVLGVIGGVSIIYQNTGYRGNDTMVVFGIASIIMSIFWGLLFSAIRATYKAFAEYMHMNIKSSQMIALELKLLRSKIDTSQEPQIPTA